MTKLVIELGKDDSVQLYRTREEWDASYYSHATHQKNLAEIEKQRIAQGHMGRVNLSTDIASSEPYAFPCIAVEGCIRNNPNGYDTMEFVFIYDFEIQEDA